MHYLLIGYMFLFVHRPFEIWPILGEIRLERVYMLVTLLVWALYPDKRWLNNPLHAAFAAFGMAVLLCWGMSPWMDEGQLVVENWFKIAVFYVLLVTTIHDERRLRLMVLAFLGVMALYLTHSFREYLGGRHTYRMGTVRMIGVDSSMGDPNTFGSSILYALPLVSIFWHKARGWFKGALLAYVGLSILCLLLTGSRGSLLGLLILGLLTVWQTRSRFAWIALAAVALPVGFMALPENLQNRFETIVNPEAGPQTAQDSGHGRIEGLVLGLKTWGDNPITGVGPGAWRPATGSTVEAHNLYGQIVGEMGTLGLMTFAAVVFLLWRNLRQIKRMSRSLPPGSGDFLPKLGRALSVSLFMLLLMGNAGHNLFRFNWLWFGAFAIIAAQCMRVRLAHGVTERYFVPAPRPRLRLFPPARNPL